METGGGPRIVHAAEELYRFLLEITIFEPFSGHAPIKNSCIRHSMEGARLLSGMSKRWRSRKIRRGRHICPHLSPNCRIL